MGLKKKTPPGQGRGFRKTDLLDGSIGSENSLLPSHPQAQSDFVMLGDVATVLVTRLAHQHRISRAHARVVAELCFGEVAA